MGVSNSIENSKENVKELQGQIDALFKVLLASEEHLSKMGKGASHIEKHDFTDYEEGFRQLREEFEKFHREAFGLNLDPYTKELQVLQEKYQEGFIKINDTRNQDLAKVKENEQKGILTTRQAASERVKIQRDTEEARLDAESAYYANLNALQQKHRDDVVAKQKERADRDFKEALENQKRMDKALGEQADAHFREQVTIAKNNEQANPSFGNKRALADAERDQQLREQTKLLQEQKITQLEFDSDMEAIQREHSKKIAQAYADEFTKYEGYARKALDTIGSIEKNAADRRIANIQRQIDMNNRLKEAEVRNIEESTMSASQKAATLMQLEAKTAANAEMLRRKEREEKIKEARFDKAKAIMDIILNTAKAITEDLKSPLKIVLDVAIGAAQLAVATSQKIPQYAIGTDFHPGGPMVVHPGELRVDPSGEVSMTPNKPTLTMGARGTKIIPAEEVNQMLLAGILARTARLIQQPDSSMVAEIRELKDTVRAASHAQINALGRQKAPVIHVHNDAHFWAHIDKTVRN